MGDIAPAYESVLEEMAEAERREGWLARCERAGLFAALNAAFVESLAETLSKEDGPIVEVAAGDGALSASLAERGLAARPTDPAPRTAAVERATAAEALARHRPATAIAAFPPFDAGVEEAVLADPGVRCFVIVNARFGGALGSPVAAQIPGWRSELLEAPTRWLLTRHDVWLGPDAEPIRHGEVWRYARVREEAAA